MYNGTCLKELVILNVLYDLANSLEDKTKFEKVLKNILNKG